MFEPFQQFIPRAAAAYGISNEVKAAKVCHSFKMIIAEIFATHENPEQFISPAYFKNGELMVNVDNGAWAQEIIMKKEKIIEEMNKKAQKEVVKSLRTQLKKA